MSGGQKQRIAVARAVYASADVYLFDDPLSALDSKVGRQVFRACIAGELAGKTRVLVTNQLQYVPEADKVVVLKDGHIVESGPYADLMARKNGVLAEMMQDVQTDLADEGALFRTLCMLRAVLCAVPHHVLCVHRHAPCHAMCAECTARDCRMLGALAMIVPLH